MSRRIQLANTYSSRQLDTISKKLNIKKRELGIVLGVVLDDSDKSKEILSVFDLENDKLPLSAFVGHIIVQRFSDFSGIGPFDLLPPYIEDAGYPIINETVRIIDDGSKPHYKRISSVELNIGNFKEKASDVFFGEKRSEPSKEKNYQEVSDTGISNSESSSTIIENEYFTPDFFHKLKLNEGDKLLQSRFGQSIRFSGYNNEERELSPTIIIRNRQNDISKKDVEENKLISEDVNRDGSTILLSSNKYKIPFQPGTIDDGGSSNFKTNPINFELPQEYVGFDQMLLNSDRIILSAKSQEMLFFSKGDYGFISDGRFVIDNGEAGADLDFGDDVNITTDRNDGNFTVQTGDGGIFLNTTERVEPLIRGEKLYEFLDKLLTILENFQSLGFAGLSITNGTPIPPPIGSPEGTPPTTPTKTELTALRATLQDLKSTKNFTE